MVRAKPASARISSSVMHCRRAVRFGDVDVPGQLLCPAPAVDELHPFVPEHLPDDRSEALAEGRLEDVELVGVDRALDDVLAEAVRARDKDHVAETRVGVEREDHAARGEVGADHLHHPDRERDLEVVEPVVDPVRDRAVREEGGVAPAAGLAEGPVPADVQVGLLLAGERGRREVLGRGRTPDGDVRVRAVLVAEEVVRGPDLGPEVVGDPGAEDQVAGPLAPALELGDVALVKARHRLFQCRQDAGGVERVPVGLGGRGEPVRDPHPPGRELAVHLPERGVLPPDYRDIRVPDVLEPADIPRVLLHCRPPTLPPTAVTGHVRRHFHSA